MYASWHSNGLYDAWQLIEIIINDNKNNLVEVIIDDNKNKNKIILGWPQKIHYPKGFPIVEERIMMDCKPTKRLNSILNNTLITKSNNMCNYNAYKKSEWKS